MLESGKLVDRRLVAITSMVLVLVSAGIGIRVFYKVLDLVVDILFVLSISMAPTVYILKREMSERTNLSNAGMTVLAVLNDVMDLKEDTAAKRKCITIKNNGVEHQLGFYPVYVEHLGFDSVVSAGHFILFPSEVQKGLNHIHLRIVMNNRLMDKQQDLVDYCIRHGIKEDDADGRYYDIMFNTWLQLTKVQKELLGEIEALRPYFAAKFGP